MRFYAVISIMALGLIYNLKIWNNSIKAHNIYNLICLRKFEEAADIVDRSNRKNIIKIFLDTYPANGTPHPLFEKRTAWDCLLGNWQIYEPPCDFGYVIIITTFNIEYFQATHG